MSTAWMLKFQQEGQSGRNRDREWGQPWQGPELLISLQ